MSYQTALICTNGHIVNGNMEEWPVDNQAFCSECGANTIDKCKNCGTKIKGDNNYGIGYEHLQEAHSHCSGCGKAFPWLDEKLKAAKELIDEMEQLNTEEREKLKTSIDDLIINGPRTELAVTRFKKLIPKAGKDLANGMRAIIVEIASETAKKSLGL
ncbi:DUF2321 domain-containing protein [Bacillus sp. BA3]|uniref:DUF2321 domain-containing protein n=1 Tax=Bacillus sp. BA3 TaxID=2057910 RepID=UPI000C34725B|nr:DUF2321 domain-containing protein [Bacillus sp. BA3]PKF88422.1 DUF2321 domain-containing protein [Bacillus sp. BA3]